METTIDEVSIEIGANSQSASSNLENLANSITKLTSVLNSGLKGLSSFSTNLAKVKEITSGFSIDTTGIEKIQTSLSGLTGFSKATNLSSMLTQLQKIPEISKKLSSTEISNFTSKIKELMNALSPLATEMTKVSTAFSALPSNVSKINSALSSTTKTAKQSSGVFSSGLFSGISGLAIKGGLLIATMKRLGSVLGSFVNESNAYIENMNLFTVSMGEAAQKAQEFTDRFSAALGVDPSNVMRYMGMFNTLVEGFGLTNEAAYTMSKNLTQLSYDMSSFLNIPIDQAMQKIKSGISGEIEPMRAVGIALDQATLQETAYTLGIDKKVASMTRAQKTELLYYQIMTKTTKMQGDMARTLITPANALRVLQQQFTLLARAVGNIFIPILTAAIPYIMLITQALTALANMIAKFFGFALPKVDYSSLSDGLGGVSSGIGDIGGSAKKTNKELDRMLNKFDELNVITFDKDSGAGAGGGGGAGAGGVGGSLGIPLPDYDALTGLAQQKLEKIKKQISKFIDKIKGLWDKVSPILKKFEPLLKGIGAMFLTAFAWGWIAKFLSKFKTMKTVGTLLTSIIGAVKLAISAFSSATTVTGGFAAAISSLWGSFKGYMQALTPMQKFKVSLVAMVGVFVTTYSAIKDFTKGTSDLGTVLLNVVPIITAAGVAMYAMLGPAGLVITAITAVTAGVIAYNKAQKEMADDRALARMFDGQGQSMEAVIDYYTKLNDETSKYANTIISAGEDIDSNNEKFDETAVSIENLSSKMSSLFYSATDSDFDSMNSNFQQLGDIAQENLAKMVSGVITNINQLKNLGQIDDENAQKMIDNAIKVQQAQGNKVADLEFKMTQLNTAYRNGNKTQEEYRKEVAELLQEMARLNNGVSEAETKFKSFSDNMNATTLKINLESPEKAKKYIEELSGIYEEQVENIKNSNTQIENYYDNLIAQAEGDTALVKALEEDKTKMMAENQKHLEEIQGDYKGTWLTIRAQLAASGADTADDMKDVVDSINKNLEVIGDVDVSGKGGETINGYFQEILNSKDDNLPRAIVALKEAGYDMSDALVEGASLTETEKAILNNNWSNATQLDSKTRSSIIQSLKNDGVTIKNEYGNSLEFTDAEKKIISKILTDPTQVNAGDKAKVLSKIIEFGGEVKDAEGNSLEFTQQEKDTIKKALDSPMLSWTESDTIINATTKFTDTAMNNMISNIYSKTYASKDAGKDVGNAAGDGIITSIQGKTPEAAKSAQTLTTSVNNSMKNNINTTAAGEQAVSQFDNAMNRGKWAITNTASSIGSSAGNSFSDSLKVNDGSFKRSLNNVFSRTMRNLKSRNSGLFSALGLVLPSFNWFADGGFPETGQMFIAREAGPELVGNIGNKAAVANNDQIEAGIAKAAYQGVSQAMQENRGNERQPVNVYIGNKKVYSGYGQYVSSENNMYGTNIIKV